VKTSHPAAALTVALPSLRRSRRVVQRNALVYRHTWMVILSGFFEPVFYLLGMGLGLGAFVPAIDGIPYAAFIVPGLLASSCLNGAITDGMFNIFFKLHFQKTYEGILATPMLVPDIALGELLWALARSSLYAAGFLIVAFALGLVIGERLLLAWTAVLAFPAAVGVSAALGAMALCLTGFLRVVEDFDMVMGLLVTPMFLFSGIFFPVATLPAALQWVVAALPLYHAVELLRPLTTGAVDASLLGHASYLAAAGIIAFFVAMHRLERTLVK
jgi:lipooligosaccharide transport system permease protein